MERRYFPVGGRQPPPGGHQVHPLLALGQTVVAVLAAVLHDTDRDSRLAAMPAVGVERRVARGAEEPRAWVLGQPAATTPRGEERLTDDVVHVHRVSTPADEAQPVLVLSAVDIGERVHHPRRCNARVRRSFCAGPQQLGQGTRQR